VASPRQAAKRATIEYLDPEFKERSSFGRARGQYHRLEGSVRKAAKQFTQELDFDQAYDYALGKLRYEYPDKSEKDLESDLLNMVDIMMSSQVKQKRREATRLETAFDEGAATTLKAIEPSSLAREQMKAGQTWELSDDEIAANILKDSSIDITDRIAVKNKDWDNVSVGTLEKMMSYEGPTAGPPPKSEGAFEKFINWATTLGRAGGGGVVGALEGLSQFGEMEIEIPDAAEREQALQELNNVDEPTVNLMREIAYSGGGGMGPAPLVVQGSDSRSATGATYGFNMGKALTALAAEPERIGQVWDSIKEHMYQAWDRPGTEGDVAVFLGKRLGKYRDMAYKKAVQETGIRNLDESSPEQNLLDQRAKEITKWLIAMDGGEMALNNPLVTRFLVETFTDPTTFIGTIAKGGLAAAKAGVQAGSKVPFIGRGVAATGEAFAHGTSAAKAKARTAARWAMQQSGFGHAPESMDLATMAERAPELHKELAHIAVTSEGEDLARAARTFADLGITSADEAVELGMETGKAAETLRLGVLTSSGKAIKLKPLEEKMWKLHRTIKNAGDDVQEALFLAHEGSGEALQQLGKHTGAKYQKIKKAQIAMRELADEHLRYLELTGQRHAFDPLTGELRAAGTVEQYVPHVMDIADDAWKTGIGPGGATDARRALRSDFNLGVGPRAAQQRIGGARHLENASEAWERTLRSTTGQAGVAGIKMKTMMKYAKDGGLMKVFSKTDEASAKAYASAKAATTGIRWGSLDDIVAAKAKKIFGDDVTGATDFMRRVLGDVDTPLKRGESMAILPQALGDAVADAVALRGDFLKANKLVDGFISSLRPIQGVFRAGVTVPSLAFQISQLATVPFLKFMAHGVRGLHPGQAYDAAKVAWYAALDGSDLLKNSRITGKFIGKHLDKLRKSKISTPTGKELTVEQFSRIVKDTGLSKGFKAKWGLDIGIGATAEAERGALGFIPKAAQLFREGMDEYFFRPFYWANELIDDQQKAAIFLGALKNPDDVNDIMRAAEYARKWAVGNVSGTAMGPAERAIREAFGFYGFLRWTHQWAGRMVTSPEKMARLATVIRERQMEEAAFGKHVPVHAEAISPYRQHMITAPLWHQPKAIREGMAKRVTAHKFAMMQREDPLTLLAGVINNAASVIGKGRMDPQEMSRMLGPGASAMAEIMLGFDPRTGEERQAPFFWGGETQWWESRAFQMATEFGGIGRLKKEMMDIWNFANPETPAETMDLATKLAARNSGKGLELIARYLTTGEWATDESTTQYLLTFMHRLYPNSPMWAALERKRRAMEKGRLRGQETARAIKQTPEFLIGGEQ